MPRTKSATPRVRTAPKATTIEALLTANLVERIAATQKEIAKMAMGVDQLAQLQRAVRTLESAVKPTPARRAKAAAVAAVAQ